MAELNGTVFPEAGDDLENRSSPETSDHEGEEGRGGSGSFFVGETDQEESSSNYTDCTSSSEDLVFKSFESGGVDEANPSAPANGGNAEGSESDGGSNMEEDEYVVSSSMSEVDDEEDDDDVEVSCLCVSTVGGLLTVPYVESGSQTASLPFDVQRENRKNIVKTLQGQADIINNWSSIRKPDGRQVLKFLDGAHSIATKFHRNIIGTIRAGRDFSNRPRTPVPTPTKVAKSQSAPAAEPESEKKPQTQPEDPEVAAGDPEVSTALGVTSKKLYSCVKCADDFKFKKFRWNQHVIKAHGRYDRHSQLFTCQTCEKVFGHNYSLKAHIRTHKKQTA